MKTQSKTGSPSGSGLSSQDMAYVGQLSWAIFSDLKSGLHSLLFQSYHWNNFGHDIHIRDVAFHL